MAKLHDQSWIKHIGWVLSDVERQSITGMANFHICQARFQFRWRFVHLTLHTYYIATKRGRVPVWTILVWDSWNVDQPVVDCRNLLLAVVLTPNSLTALTPSICWMLQEAWRSGLKAAFLHPAAFPCSGGGRELTARPAGAEPLLREYLVWLPTSCLGRVRWAGAEQEASSSKQVVGLGRIHGLQKCFILSKYASLCKLKLPVFQEEVALKNYQACHLQMPRELISALIGRTKL